MEPGGPSTSTELPEPRLLPHRGVDILIFGLLAMLPCFATSIVFGVIAKIMADVDLSGIRSGRVDGKGERLAKAGRVLGIVGMSLWPAVWAIGFLAAFRAR